MQISYKCDYALKVLLDLAVNRSKGVITSADMAKRLDIPLKFLEQVLSELKRGGFVDSRRGSAGGYTLALEPAKILIGDIVRLIDGPIEPIACVDHKYKGCSDLRSCAFRSMWCEVNQAISNIVDNRSIEDMLKQVSSENTILNFSI